MKLDVPRPGALSAQNGLEDGFGRRVTYVRISVTDRCDLRCIYCMAEEMVFQPREQILSFEEILRLARALVELGVSKIRLTGGEPLVRRGIVDLAQQIADLPGLRELVLTTNGTRLAPMASELRRAGVRRINISLDTLNENRYREMTRVGSLQDVLEGIDAAKRAGFESVKINAVILRGRNFDEVEDLVNFALDRDLDVTFIEEMPLGSVDGRSRMEEFCSSHEILRKLQEVFSILPSSHTTGGPARFWQVAGRSSRIGFISPQTHNFCSDCNRIRVTADGKLLPCLGHENATDLRELLRSPGATLGDIKALLRYALQQKPKHHDFTVTERPVLFRHMSRTGG